MNFREKLKKRIRENRAESIAETLIALLIASAGLIMLAYMISSGSRMIRTSSEKMNSYYGENNKVAAGKDSASSGSGDTAETGTLTLKLAPDSPALGDPFTGQSFEAEYVENDTFARTPVISYHKKAAAGEGGDNP